MLKPPIARMGGKSRLRKQIISMIPEHTCYIEPFFGAGWVFFGKEPSKVEVINDVDRELINLFKMIKHHPGEIERLMQFEISSRDSFAEYKKMEMNALTDIQRAVQFIFLISQSFASKGISFGYGTNTRPSPQIFDTSNLKNLKERLRNTYIENLSFEEIFARYDRPYSFYFCDPPYYETDGYKDKFDYEDHMMLRDILLNVHGQFLLTINDHPEVRKWYKDFYMIETKVPYSIGKEQESRKKYNELIITNYEVNTDSLKIV
ncbi:DNA adenine methylase [Geosporobacter ferrireducens]|uniref:DNA adenine methylase n=1 Tax=Geosporobacter ferrireducens TaxID=1424294 RepID=UPI00139BF913|nr:DNA adenine methylase [Geosporobacter ferrireducens]MTI53758.1 DNA adenine methylase [Geosporobacter ferrireducens]